MPTPEGTLTWEPADRHTDLLGAPVAAALHLAPSARVASIDPTLADTAAFCGAYDSDPAHSANCVVVAGKRGGEVRRAAIMVLATDRADVNGIVRRHLDLRKISFAPMDDAVALTGMEYGGITPVGLPEGWPILVDARVAEQDVVIIGSGVRRSKILLPGRLIAELPGARLIDGLGLEAAG